MGLVELFVAVLIAGVSSLNAVLPALAGRRTGDPRFVLLTAANALFALLGVLWAWGELDVGAPSWTSVNLPILGVALLGVLLLLASTAVRPRST